MECLICNKNCTNNNSLAQHVRMNHDMRILDYKLKFEIIKKEQLFCKQCNIGLNSINAYNLCYDCYQTSEERKIVASKCVKNRPNYDGRIILTIKAA